MLSEMGARRVYGFQGAKCLSTRLLGSDRQTCANASAGDRADEQLRDMHSPLSTLVDSPSVPAYFFRIPSTCTRLFGPSMPLRRIWFTTQLLSSRSSSISLNGSAQNSRR